RLGVTIPRRTASSPLGPCHLWRRLPPGTRTTPSGYSLRDLITPVSEPAPGVDLARAEAAVRELLIAIGEDPDREGLRETPARVARAYREMFAGLFTDPDLVLERTFDEGHDELVLVRDIPMYSQCEHHLVPFHGMAHVGYIPNEAGRVTGLSKLARLVDLYAKRPQVQERLTSQVAAALVHRLEPRGAIVGIAAQPPGMALR